METCQQVYRQNTEQSSKERVARKEKTAEVPNYLNWGREADLSGDKVTGLEEHVEATNVVEVTAKKPSNGDQATDHDRTLWEASLDTGECQPGQYCLGRARGCFGETCQYDTDTVDNYQGNYNARSVLEASLDTDHYGGCSEESEPCQVEVCRYDPKGEYDTDNGNNHKSGAELDKAGHIHLRGGADQVGPGIARDNTELGAGQGQTGPGLTQVNAELGAGQGNAEHGII